MAFSVLTALFGLAMFTIVRSVSKHFLGGVIMEDRGFYDGT